MSSDDSTIPPSKRGTSPSTLYKHRTRALIHPISDGNIQNYNIYLCFVAPVYDEAIHFYGRKMMSNKRPHIYTSAEILVSKWMNKMRNVLRCVTRWVRQSTNMRNEWKIKPSFELNIHQSTEEKKTKWRLSAPINT